VDWVVVDTMQLLCTAVVPHTASTGAMETLSGVDLGRSHCRLDEHIHSTEISPTGQTGMWNHCVLEECLLG
jgi:hypothetical protein